jgi:hypothetical protein
LSSPWSDIVGAVTDRIDADLLPALYAAASITTSDIRAEFEEQGISYLEPGAQGSVVSLSDLELAAIRVVRQTRSSATVVAAVSGLVGPLAVPPEVLASLVQILRLAQRLAVLFGFDPETDSGRIVMWRAIAAAFEVELPSQGQLGLKVRDLPALLKSQLPAAQAASAWLGRRILSRSITLVARRVSKLIPGLGAGISAWSALRRTEEAGDRMIAIYRRACEGAPIDWGDEVLAVEIP